MVGENTKIFKTPLLPDRYPIDDFFICDVTDAIPKDDLGSMEHPIFSLSTKPDTRIREYSHNNISITVSPSAQGLATIHDKDILIYCISQLIAKLNAGGEAKKTLHLKAYDLLVATNRKTDGRGYEQLVAAFDRLSGTRIKTNLKTGGEEFTEGFGLLDSWRIVRHTHSGRMLELKVSLSDWVFNAVMGSEVLTLHRNYFRLRKPLERRIYELARKHCGQKLEWCISLELLQKKCGSASTLKEFRRLVASIVEEDAAHAHMPDYSVYLDDGDMLHIRNRVLKLEFTNESTIEGVFLAESTYEQARRAAPGFDIYAIEKEWRDWMTERPQNPDAAFIGFCRKWFERSKSV